MEQTTPKEINSFFNLLLRDQKRASERIEKKKNSDTFSDFLNQISKSLKKQEKSKQDDLQAALAALGISLKPSIKQDPVRKEKAQAVDMALAQIEKQFGKGAIMKFDEDARTAVEAIPTGSLSLDLALGVGGIPKGRIIEVYGPESSGKTTLASHMIAEVQKQGGQAAFIDAEHAFDPEYAKKLGVDVDELLISQPDAGEQALDITETLIKSGGVDIVVIDSVAALTPRAEIEGDMGDSHMGLHARLMSQALRKLTGVISRSNTTVVFINQIRMKIGVMFGNPETVTGGNALKFYSSVRLDIRRAAQIKEGENVMGNRTRVKVVKNKVAPPFRTAEFDIMYAQGISREGDVLDLGVTHEIVQKAGAWYEYEGTKLGQGREAAKQFLKDNPKVAGTIEKKVREAASAS